GAACGMKSDPVNAVCAAFHVPPGITSHSGCPSSPYTYRFAKSRSACWMMLIPQPFSEGPAHQRFCIGPGAAGAAFASTAIPPSELIDPFATRSASPVPPSVSVKLMRGPSIVIGTAYQCGAGLSFVGPSFQYLALTAIACGYSWPIVAELPGEQRSRRSD